MHWFSASLLLCAFAIAAMTSCAHTSIHHDAAGRCWLQEDSPDGDQHKAKWLRWEPADKCKVAP